MNNWEALSFCTLAWSACFISGSKRSEVPAGRLNITPAAGKRRRRQNKEIKTQFPDPSHKAVFFFFFFNMVAQEKRNKGEKWGRARHRAERTLALGETVTMTTGCVCCLLTVWEAEMLVSWTAQAELGHTTHPRGDTVTDCDWYYWNIPLRKRLTFVVELKFLF